MLEHWGRGRRTAKLCCVEKRRAIWHGRVKDGRGRILIIDGYPRTKGGLLSVVSSRLRSFALRSLPRRPIPDSPSSFRLLPSVWTLTLTFPSRYLASTTLLMSRERIWTSGCIVSGSGELPAHFLQTYGTMAPGIRSHYITNACRRDLVLSSPRVSYLRSGEITEAPGRWLSIQGLPIWRESRGVTSRNFPQA